MNKITVETTVNAPLSKVWAYWNEPEHIPGWAFASEDWEAPLAENDLRVGGKFRTVMASKNGNSSFDFTGTYTAVSDQELIEYNMDRAPAEEQSRHVKVEFTETPEGVKITETFDPESENTEELQRAGWQAILDNFKKYTENL